MRDSIPKAQQRVQQQQKDLKDGLRRNDQRLTRAEFELSKCYSEDQLAKKYQQKLKLIEHRLRSDLDAIEEARQNKSPLERVASGRESHYTFQVAQAKSQAKISKDAASIDLKCERGKSRRCEIVFQKLLEERKQLLQLWKERAAEEKVLRAQIQRSRKDIRKEETYIDLCEQVAKFLF